MPEGIRGAPVEAREMDDPVGIRLDGARGELARGDPPSLGVMADKGDR